jgi:hypothetical protein
MLFQLARHSCRGRRGRNTQPEQARLPAASECSFAPDDIDALLFRRKTAPARNIVYAGGPAANAVFITDTLNVNRGSA